MPRNDIYANYSKDDVTAIKNKLNISNDKSVILYAPTYREYDKSGSVQCQISIPINIKKWEKELGNEFILLFRAHYEVARNLNIQDNDFIKDMSNYPQLDELMIVSDMLISDYSSIYFDYSIMHKPMLCFCYDYDRYAKERGMYFDIRDYLPNSDNEEDLIKLIQNTDTTKENAATKLFQEHFVTEYGSAAQKSIDIIYDAIKIS